MTQEDKELLLKDLCARLPYGVIVEYNNDGCSATRELGLGSLHDFMFDNAELKPYLRPMSSMTDEEKREIYDWLVENDVDWFDFSKLRLDEILISFDSSWLLVNWLLKNHFDFMGLIPKNSAIEVTKENNPYKE